MNTHLGTGFTLLAVDQLGSPASRIKHTLFQRVSYLPYGHSADLKTARAGFTGQVPEAGFKQYLLGNGYRGYSPSLMRFIAADAYSPFGRGGLNSYAYCGGAPTIRTDPDGHSPVSSLFKGIANRVGRVSSRKLMKK